jgi:hypothetical protein
VRGGTRSRHHTHRGPPATRLTVQGVLATWHQVGTPLPAVEPHHARSSVASVAAASRASRWRIVMAPKWVLATPLGQQAGRDRRRGAEDAWRDLRHGGLPRDDRRMRHRTRPRGVVGRRARGGRVPESERDCRSRSRWPPPRRSRRTHPRIQSGRGMTPLSVLDPDAQSTKRWSPCCVVSAH